MDSLQFITAAALLAFSCIWHYYRIKAEMKRDRDRIPPLFI